MLEEHCPGHPSQLAVVFAAVRDLQLQVSHPPLHPLPDIPAANPIHGPHALNIDRGSNLPAAQRKKRFPDLRSITCRSLLWVSEHLSSPQPHPQASHLDHCLPIRGFVGGGDEQPAGGRPRFVLECCVEELF